MADVKRVQVTTFKLRGIEYDVFVSEYGSFSANVEGHELSARTLDELKTDAEKVPRRKVEVPFVRIYGPHVVDGRLVPSIPKHGIATGFHATSGYTLVDWPGERKGQQEPSSRSNRDVRPLTEAEELEITRLMLADVEARQAVIDWVNAHGYDVRAAVKAALEAPEPEAVDG